MQADRLRGSRVRPDRLRSLVRLAGFVRAAVGLVVLLGTSVGSARAENLSSMPSALLEMRAAAEALADVEPEAVQPPRRDGTSKPAAAAAAKELASESAAAAKASARAALQKEIHAAVQSEIKREAQGLARGQSGTAGQSAVRKGQQDDERGRSEAAHAGEAATQAQQAKLNRAVGQDKAKNQGKGKGLTVGATMIPPAVGRPHVGK